MIKIICDICKKQLQEGYYIIKHQKEIIQEPYQICFDCLEKILNKIKR